MVHFIWLSLVKSDMVFCELQTERSCKTVVSEMY